MRWMMKGVAFTAPPGESIQNGSAYYGKKHVFSQEEFKAGNALKTNWYYSSALDYMPMRFAETERLMLLTIL